MKIKKNLGKIQNIDVFYGDFVEVSNNANFEVSFVLPLTNIKKDLQYCYVCRQKNIPEEKFVNAYFKYARIPIKTPLFYLGTTLVHEGDYLDFSYHHDFRDYSCLQIKRYLNGEVYPYITSDNQAFDFIRLPSKPVYMYEKVKDAEENEDIVCSEFKDKDLESMSLTDLNEIHDSLIIRLSEIKKKKNNVIKEIYDLEKKIKENE